jgi:hypothetical protein
VIVAGLPGADPVWHALEQACAARDIELDYTVESMRVDGDRVDITVFGVDADGGSAVVVRRNDGGTTLAIALDRGTPAIRAHALVTSGSGDAANADLVVTTSGEARRVTHDEVVLGFASQSTIVLERDAIAVFGGTYRARSEDSGR